MTETNYSEFAKLMKSFKDEKFKMVLFPCNQFGGQEGSTDSESLRRNSTGTLDLEDPDMAKQVFVMGSVDVNGDKTEPVFEYLKYNSSLHDETKRLTAPISWNFAKFLVDAKGGVYRYYGPTTKPLTLENDIKELMKNSERKSRTRRSTRTTSSSP